MKKDFTLEDIAKLIGESEGRMMEKFEEAKDFADERFNWLGARLDRRIDRLEDKMDKRLEILEEKVL